MKIKATLVAVGASAAVLSSVVAAGPALAGDASVSETQRARCPCSGKLYFVDFPRNHSSVSGDNKDWAKFGWADRADHFYNGGKNAPHGSGVSSITEAKYVI